MRFGTKPNEDAFNLYNILSVRLFNLKTLEVRWGMTGVTFEITASWNYPYPHFSFTLLGRLILFRLVSYTKGWK